MENSTRLNSLTAIAPAFAAVAFAGAASAETIITEYGGLTATLSIEDGDSQMFNLNPGDDSYEGDDYNDFEFRVFRDQIYPDKEDLFSEVGEITSLNEGFKPFLTLDAEIKPFGGIARDNDTGFATEFFAGDSVGADSDFGSTAELYRDSDGPLGEGRDTMFVGLSLTLYPYTMFEETDVTAFSVVNTAVEQKMLPVTPFTTYGWAEFERGSLTLLRTGYDPTGAAAKIPGVAAVPLPAPLLLLATGAAGLAAMRRRQRKAA